MSRSHRDPASSPRSPKSGAPEQTSHVSVSESVRFLRHSPTPSSNTHPILASSSDTLANPSPTAPFNTPQKTAPAIDGRQQASPPPQRPQRFSRPLLSSLSTDDLRKVSPRDRLNAFLASPQSSSSSPGNPPTAALPLPPPIPPSFNVGPSSPAVPQPRNVSSPFPRSIDKPSSKSMAASVDQVQGVRNASIDPSPTSLSAKTPPPQPAPAGAAPPSPVPSPDSAANTGLDAAALITSAGSAEAAVEKLLKEKQTTAARSEQLWKLVEKQRAMIMGLNKDLERALQDKERYRKKVKEYQTAQESTSKRPSKPEDRGPSSTSARETTFQSIPVSDLSKDGPHQKMTEVLPPQIKPLASPLPKDLETKQTTEPPVQNRTESNMSQRANESEADRQAVLSTPPRKGKSYVDESAQNRLSPMDNNVHGTKLSISTRRAAPAPLDLSASATSATSQPVQKLAEQLHERENALEDSTSMLVDSPPIDRGRRKTREDDDRLREQIAIEEEQRRSSKKSDGSKSKSRGATEKAVAIGAPQAPVTNTSDGQPVTSRSVGLPTSPRAPTLGVLQSPLPMQGIGSIGSTLHAVSAPPIPQTATQNAIPPHMLPQKSPGLPMSPRPGDRPMNSPMPRMPKAPIASPGPPTPRSGLPFSPRAPTKPIPLPPQSLLALQSPHLARAEQYHQRQQSHSAVVETMMGDETPRAEQRPFFSNHSPTQSTEVFKGFVSDQYPDFLLPPNALPLIDVKVYSSRLRPSRNSLLGPNKVEDDPIFTLAVHSRSDDLQLWRVEKTVTSLFNLDQSVKAQADVFVQLPERSLFAGHAPAKIDARRSALMQYFDDLLNTQMSESTATVVCAFFSSDVIAPHAEQTRVYQETDSGIAVSPAPEKNLRTEGYLGKKGKQFGGWKARYFVIDGSELRYYEAPGGTHLGNIKLHHAQIAKQNAKESDDDAEFRHAFMILEPKRRDSSSLVRHVLCAESDEERDSWVEALMACIDSNDVLEGVPTSPVSPGSLAKTPSDASQNGAISLQQQNKTSSPHLESHSYEEMIAAEAPVLGTTRTNSDPPTPEENDSVGAASTGNSSHPNISGPLSGGPIQNVSAWGNKPSPTPPASRDRDKDTKKSKMFGFISRTSEDLPKSPQPFPNAAPPPGKRKGPLRAVFGIPLAEAAEICPPIGINLCLPSPVYRCVEYLQGRNALKEEGIFRLNGSSVVIKALKERFNTEGDVKLLGGQYYDIHAVASLLKLYLRELPDPVLTRNLHLNFLKVLDIDDKQQKLNAANFLVHKLPQPNLELLDTLSRFLIDIVNNSDINKMTVRNIGIVFAPTLNIPAPLLSIFLEEYKAVFQNPVDASSVPSSITESGASSVSQGGSTHKNTSSSSSGNSIGTDDLRSPRKQMFSEVTTPAPDQTSFPGFQPMQSHQQQYYHQDPRMAYDTGFVPMQQSSRQQHTQPSPPKSQSPLTQVPDPSGYTSLNAILSPGPGTTFFAQSSSSQQPTISAPMPLSASTQPHSSTFPAPVPTPSPGPPPGYGGTPLQQPSSSSSASASAHSTSSSPADTPTLGSSDADRRKQRRESAMLGTSTGLGVNGANANSTVVKTLEGGRQSSLQRLREAAGSAGSGSMMKGVREED